jgi:hypothetical protein
MSYTEIFNKVIDYSNMSIRNISAESKRYDKSISPSYISRLKNNDTAPATEEVNRMIAEICGYPDPDELVFEAYIENAPQVIKTFISGLLRFFEKTFTQAYINGLPKKEAGILKEQFYNDDFRYSILKTFLDNRLIDSMFKSLKNPIAINSKKQKMIIPNFGAYIMLDDSMSPTISKGDKLQINSSLNIGIGDIGLFQFEGEKELKTRRLFKEDGKLLLIPENKRHNIIKCNPEKVTIHGKVIAIIKEIPSTTYDKIINMD